MSCTGATHVPRRWDESGRPYDVSADDSAYATFQLEGGIVAHFNSSWTVRVRRDDLLTLQVDGTKGSAVAGLRDCWVQSYESTPRPVWNPDIENRIKDKIDVYLYDVRDRYQVDLTGTEMDLIIDNVIDIAKKRDGSF